MKLILSLLGMCILLNSCSNINNTAIISNDKNNVKVIELPIFMSNCKNNLLCDYVSWFQKSSAEIENLQKEYGISYSIPTIEIKNEFLDKNILIKNQKFIKKLRTTTKCQDGNIDKIIFDKNALLFSCRFSKDKEFRYTIYFGNIKNNSLKLQVIDTGGGTFE